MSTEIISKVAVPVKVVGLQQYLYRTEDFTGDLVWAVSYAEARTVDSLETLAADTTVVVRERQARIEELGRAIAALQKAKAYLDTKKYASDSYSEGMDYVYRLQQLRGYPFGLTGPIVRKDTVEVVMSNVQHQSDVMSSRLNDATSALNDYVSRRDKAYSHLDKALSKIRSGMAKAIREMG